MNTPSSFPDRAMEQVTRAVARRTNRRSLLGTLSRMVLGILGVEVLPILPVDRRALGSVAGGTAQVPEWQKCGAYGYLCETCDKRSNECPNNLGCAQDSQSWSACCYDDFSVGWTIEYYDCCIDGSDPTTGCSKTNNQGCPGYPPPSGGKPAWCMMPNTTYCCSVVVDPGIPC